MTPKKNPQESFQKEKTLLRKQLATRLIELRKTEQKAKKETQKRKSAEDKIHRALFLLRRQRNELQALAGKLISIQEEERKRISRDLHDDTNQKLAMIAVQVENLEQRLPLPVEDLQKKLKGLHGQIKDLANEVRSLAHHLHPSVLDHLGLTKALQAYVDDFSSRENMKVMLICRNFPQTLSSELALCLYRVAQECLGNVAKHARASHITLSLIGLKKSLRLVIEDDGIGMSSSRLKNYEKGLGFISIQERVRLVKGKLRVTSQPKKGTKVLVQVPKAHEP